MPWAHQPRIARPDAIECLHAQVGWLLGVRGWMAKHEPRAARGPLLRAGQLRRPPWIEMVAALSRTMAGVGVVHGGWHARSRLRMGNMQPGPIGVHGAGYYRFTQDAAFCRRCSRAQNALAYLQRLCGPGKPIAPAGSALLRMAFTGVGPAPRCCRNTLCRSDLGAAGLERNPRPAAEAEATWADEQYRLLKAQVRRSLRARMDLMTGMWVPGAAEDEQLDIQTVALLFWPGAETDLVEPHELQTSLDMFYADFLQRRQPGWSGVMANDEGALLGPLATMGRTDYAREVLYSLLDRRQPRGWQQPDISTSDPRQMGLSPRSRISGRRRCISGRARPSRRETDKQLICLPARPPSGCSMAKASVCSACPPRSGR